jgi:lipoprotein signal peptidase
LEHKIGRKIALPVIALFLAAAAVLADQLLKILVNTQLKPLGSVVAIPGFLNFDYVENRGAAFGIFQNQRWFFILCTVIITIAIIVALFKYKGHEFFSWTACILIIAGGIGNLIDRVFIGYVTDYIHVMFFPPVFNFADMCVTVGTVCLAIHIFFFFDKHKKDEPLQNALTPDDSSKSDL